MALEDSTKITKQTSVGKSQTPPISPINTLKTTPTDVTMISKTSSCTPISRTSPSIKVINKGRSSIPDRKGETFPHRCNLNGLIVRSQTLRQTNAKPHKVRETKRIQSNGIHKKNRQITGHETIFSYELFTEIQFRSTFGKK